MRDSLLSVPQAAKRLGIAPKTMRNWMSLRKIEYIKIGGSSKIRESEIERIINAGVVPVGGDNA